MTQKAHERFRTKDAYAISLLILLVFQVIIMNAVFIFVGLGILSLTDAALQVFAGCTMSQICGLVYCVVKSFFRQ
ncbi:MAG: hypothetical protein P0Y63_04090 [Klebsiella huaxiensis]|uniref:hypothetical protein n=1 Tax=Klebsiella huaxiensis TaxID=2153354 RepID=UPI0026F1D3EE|nr:hypothetical protein [Klebsiella huaxiensis]WEJ90207.1 MAG: hypothetical protein P0Y63_04090 [Klebsiella huaxiensis]